MVLLKKRSVRRRRNRRRPIQLSAYQLGHIAGFKQGKEDGFQQGRSDASRVRNSTNIIEAPLPLQLDVLVITAGIIPSLEIGIVQPFNELHNRGNFNYEIRTEEDVSQEHVAAAHTIVFLRNVEPASYTYLELAHQLGKRTVYVIDDNFLELEPHTPVGEYYADPSRRETLIQFLRNSQIVKVDSQILGDYIQERFSRDVIYFPGSVDFNWLDQYPKNETDGQIVIGYEGGNKEADFAKVVPALRRILDYYGGFVRLEFYGFVPAALANHPMVTFEECGMDYRSFIRKLCECNWDIGLAPLERHSFNNNKTNNKFREYGACRIAGIYSDSPVYRPWVTHGETGYLVPHTEDGWYEGLRTMIENPPMRHQIIDRADSMVRQNFSLDVCVEHWNSAILSK